MSMYTESSSCKPKPEQQTSALLQRKTETLKKKKKKKSLAHAEMLPPCGHIW